jgi:adenylate kinase
MNIILLGPQGSGKGTQAKFLAEKLGLFYIEMGGILREAAKVNPQIDEMINKKGQLVPDGLTLSILKSKLEKEKLDLTNLLFDGFPRSVAQYQLLKEWFTQKGVKIDKAILLEISEEETIRRLSARRICPKCGNVYNLVTTPKPINGKCACGGELIQRKDDFPEAIKTRLSLYNQVTFPLVEVMEKEGILVRVKGERPIEVISQYLLEKLQGI